LANYKASLASNFPDLNTIEPTCGWMKRKTTEKGTATSARQMKEDWIEYWRKLKIQEWIERIPEYFKQIIKYKGRNEYREGLGRRKRNPSRIRLSLCPEILGIALSSVI
jgi:hypothetical protein